LKISAEFLKRSLFENKARTIGIFIISFFVFIAVFADWIVPYDPKAFGVPFQKPSWDHILGTNDMGQDIFSEVIYGTRPSLLIGIAAATLSIIIGVIIGLIAGYYRGIMEDIVLGATDIFILIPGLPLMILITTYLTPSFWNVILVIGILWWSRTARAVHSKVIQVRERDFVNTAKSMGKSHSTIMWKHIMVNTKDVIFAKYVMAISSAMIAEASLAFIGMGDPFHLSWGAIINHAFSRGGYALGLWWWYLVPGIMISVVAFSFILLSWPSKRNKVEQVVL